MSRDEIKSILIEYLVEELYFDHDDASEDLDLFESGSIDSLGFINLLNFLQTTCNVKFKPADIRPETFRTINLIADFMAAQVGKTVSA